MKSLTVFAHVLLQDMGERCCISTSRDAQTVAARVKDEGISFLTISLPAFGKGFQKSLDRGWAAPDLFPGFRRGKGGLPVFLQGFLELVFDRETGRLLDEPSIDAIRSVHQFTSAFGKIELPCTEARVAKAFAAFVKTEDDVRTADQKADLSELRRTMRVLFADILTEVDRKVYYGEIVPKHGPGATAERLSSHEKYSHMQWTERLEEYFPSGEFLFPNLGWWELAQEVAIVRPGAELPVRVVAVPKTLKTPRIIAIEPVAMQYAQQGLLEAILEGLRGDHLLWGLLGFLDQTPNQRLAQEGSRSGLYATLDLKEASDRVSSQHVRALLHDHPHLLGATYACRSRKADVPGHGVKRLAKFASMGSALTFPMETMVFTAIVFQEVCKGLGLPVARSSLKKLSGRVRIYGDDIIVPVETMRSVWAGLESFGFVVNADKSFGAGKFRESCGGDYYDGHRITPVRVRSVFPSRRKHVDELVATVALRNLLFEAGYEKSTAWLDDLIGKLLPVFPFVPPTSPALGRHTYEPIEATKICPVTHRPLVKAYVPKYKIPRDPLDGHGALMKIFLKRSELPFADRSHLQRAGRAAAVDIKLRGVPTIMWGLED